MPSLQKLLWLQRPLIKLRILYYNNFWKMQISPTARLSMTVKLDKTHPVGLHIGDYTYVAFGAAILTHDMVRSLDVHTYIGSYCFIGARSIILPGIHIGDHSIVAAGAIVTSDVPPHSIVAGVPARVIKEGIETGEYGVLKKREHARAQSADALT
jgi:acetyltransferase-like isoleucine patch superfamily enzyme